MASTICKGFELPKPELLTFDGNPMSYHKFIENFEANLAKEANSDQMRLVYLIQQCRGDAKKAIDFFVNLRPPERIYQMARQTLKRRYGQSHIISDVFIKQVSESSPIKNGDGDGLLRFCTNLQNCEITLTQLGCESDLNSLKFLDVVKRLPKFLQRKWVDVANKILENQCSAIF